VHAGEGKFSNITIGGEGEKEGGGGGIIMVLRRKYILFLFFGLVLKPVQ
jgi:hypothetical protein